MIRAILVPLFVAGLLCVLTGSFNPFGVKVPISRLPGLEKVAALTFDDGPSADTPAILDVLRKTGTKATFFVLGENANRYPATLKEMAKDGDEIENHTWSHPHLIFHSSSFLSRQLEETSQLIEKLTGRAPLFFRPPYGQYHLGTLKTIHEHWLFPVLWSVTGYDWLTPGADRIQANVLAGLSPGAIILLHDGGGNRAQTAQALAGIIPQAKARGFRFVLLRRYFKID